MTSTSAGFLLFGITAFPWKAMSSLKNNVQEHSAAYFTSNLE